MNIYMKSWLIYLEESGYQVNHLQSRDSKAELFQFKELVIIPERHQVFLNEQEVE